MTFMEEIKNPEIKEARIAIIGLGYVGLPLAIEFGKKFPTIGFDINPERIDQLNEANDLTNEVSKEDLIKSDLLFSTKIESLNECNVFIITVPTPVDKKKVPNLFPIESATKAIGSVLKRNDIVIYESTVYPGLTEEICAPILEKISGLKYNLDFFCGYSPERINPGDRNHTITEIVKVTSGSTPEIAQYVDELYKTIIPAGTFMAKDIKTAEAAKVIENTQRDVNIALINELSIVFDALNLDTKHVLEAAQTKWNFLPFKPGLVGGHCIGVDPYYLTHKSLAEGYKPEMILSGRKINDDMPSFIVSKIEKLMSVRDIDITLSNILILGFTFKENCPDYRNTKVIDLYKGLTKKAANVDVYDPWPNRSQIKKDFNLNLVEVLTEDNYDGVIHAVDHSIFKELYETGIEKYCKSNYIIFDVKHSLPESMITSRL